MDSGLGDWPSGVRLMSAADAAGLTAGGLGALRQLPGSVGMQLQLQALAAQQAQRLPLQVVMVQPPPQSATNPTMALLQALQTQQLLQQQAHERAGMRAAAQQASYDYGSNADDRGYDPDDNAPSAAAQNAALRLQLLRAGLAQQDDGMGGGGGDGMSYDNGGGGSVAARLADAASLRQLLLANALGGSAGGSGAGVNLDPELLAMRLGGGSALPMITDVSGGNDPLIAGPESFGARGGGGGLQGGNRGGMRPPQLTRLGALAAALAAGADAAAASAVAMADDEPRAAMLAGLGMGSTGQAKGAGRARGGLLHSQHLPPPRGPSCSENSAGTQRARGGSGSRSDSGNGAGAAAGGGAGAGASPVRAGPRRTAGTAAMDAVAAAAALGLSAGPAYDGVGNGGGGGGEAMSETESDSDRPRRGGGRGRGRGGRRGQGSRGGVSRADVEMAEGEGGGDYEDEADGGGEWEGGGMAGGEEQGLDEEGLQRLAARFRTRPGRTPKVLAQLGPIGNIAKEAASGRLKLPRGELKTLVRKVETSLAKAVSEQKLDHRERNRLAQQQHRNRQRERIATLEARCAEQEAVIESLQETVAAYERQLRHVRQAAALPLHGHDPHGHDTQQPGLALPLAAAAGSGGGGSTADRAAASAPAQPQHSRGHREGQLPHAEPTEEAAEEAAGAQQTAEVKMEEGAAEAAAGPTGEDGEGGDAGPGGLYARQGATGRENEPEEVGGWKAARDGA